MHKALLALPVLSQPSEPTLLSVERFLLSDQSEAYMNTFFSPHTDKSENFLRKALRGKRGGDHTRSEKRKMNEFKDELTNDLEATNELMVESVWKELRISLMAKHCGGAAAKLGSTFGVIISAVNQGPVFMLTSLRASAL